MTYFIVMETKRIEKINGTENLHRYFEYMMEGFLPLIIDYYKGVL